MANPRGAHADAEPWPHAVAASADSRRSVTRGDLCRDDGSEQKGGGGRSDARPSHAARKGGGVSRKREGKVHLEKKIELRATFFLRFR